VSISWDRARGKWVDERESGGASVGKMALQFAMLAGVGTIVTTASLSGEGELKAFGAMHIIARQASDVEEQVREIVGDELMYVLDCTFGRNHNLAVSLISSEKKGIFVHLAMGKVDKSVTMKKKAGYGISRFGGGRIMILSLGGCFGGSSRCWWRVGRLSCSSTR
jgi:NADPH2:quinone reductase